MFVKKENRQNNQIWTKDQIIQTLYVKSEYRPILQKADKLYGASKILKELNEKTLSVSLNKKAKNIRKKLLTDSKAIDAIDLLISSIKPNEEFYLSSYNDIWPEKIKHRMPVAPIFIRKWILSQNTEIKKIYTDGSFHINGGIGIVGVNSANKPAILISGCLTECAGSYEAEYAGIAIGLKLLEAYKIRKILHDVGEHVAKDAAKAMGFIGECQHVNGHSGHWYNEIADRLAYKKGGYKS